MSDVGETAQPSGMSLYDAAIDAFIVKNFVACIELLKVLLGMSNVDPVISRKARDGLYKSYGRLKYKDEAIALCRSALDCELGPEDQQRWQSRLVLLVPAKVPVENVLPLKRGRGESGVDAEPQPQPQPEPEPQPQPLFAGLEAGDKRLSAAAAQGVGSGSASGGDDADDEEEDEKEEEEEAGGMADTSASANSRAARRANQKPVVYSSNDDTEDDEDAEEDEDEDEDDEEEDEDSDSSPPPKGKGAAKSAPAYKKANPAPIKAKAETIAAAKSKAGGGGGGAKAPAPKRKLTNDLDSEDSEADDGEVDPENPSPPKMGYQPSEQVEVLHDGVWYPAVIITKTSQEEPGEVFVVQYSYSSKRESDVPKCRIRVPQLPEQDAVTIFKSLPDQQKHEVRVVYNLVKGIVLTEENLPESVLKVIREFGKPVNALNGMSSALAKGAITRSVADRLRNLSQLYQVEVLEVVSEFYDKHMRIMFFLKVTGGYDIEAAKHKQARTTALTGKKGGVELLSEISSLLDKVSLEQRLTDLAKKQGKPSSFYSLEKVYDVIHNVSEHDDSIDSVGVLKERLRGVCLFVANFNRASSDEFLEDTKNSWKAGSEQRNLCEFFARFSTIALVVVLQSLPVNLKSKVMLRESTVFCAMHQTASFSVPLDALDPTISKANPFVAAARVSQDAFRKKFVEFGVAASSSHRDFARALPLLFSDNHAMKILTKGPTTIGTYNGIPTVSSLVVNGVSVASLNDARLKEAIDLFGVLVSDLPIEFPETPSTSKGSSSSSSYSMNCFPKTVPEQLDQYLLLAKHARLKLGHTREDIENVLKETASAGKGKGGKKGGAFSIWLSFIPCDGARSWPYRCNAPSLVLSLLCDLLLSHTRDLA